MDVSRSDSYVVVDVMLASFSKPPPSFIASLHIRKIVRRKILYPPSEKWHSSTDTNLPSKIAIFFQIRI